LPDHLHVEPLTCNQGIMIQRLAVEADEMSSFVRTGCEFSVLQNDRRLIKVYAINFIA